MSVAVPLQSGPRPEVARRAIGARLEPRVTAAAQVQETLRRAVLDMELRPGEALSEKELTARFGVSRTPVREALLRLKDEGLVEIFPQSGTFVARIPLGAIPEAVFIRQALECAVAERLATMADAETVARIDQTIALQHETFAAGDQDGFHRADEEFHEVLAAAAGYPGAWRLAQAAKGQIDRCRRMTLPVPGRMEMVIREHLAILDAIRRQDGAGAATAMRRHLGTLLPDLERLAAENPGYFV